MLGELARLSELPVPRVHYAARDLLVMDFIENDGGEITASVERHAGELIARLHAMPRERFGYSPRHADRAAPQPNPASARSGCRSSATTGSSIWRAKPIARAASRSPLLTRIERLAERIEDYLIEPRFPSLLHGDLWTGNVLVREGRIAGFVDPGHLLRAPRDRACLHHDVRDVRKGLLRGL